MSEDELKKRRKTAMKNAIRESSYIELPRNLQSQIEDVAEGTYLAVVTAVEKVLNEETGSFGLMWDLLINTGSTDTWDKKARTVPLKHYTYIGKMQNGRLTDTSNAFKTAEIMNALGFTNGVLDTAAAKHRQVIVIIKHEPDDDGNLWPRVRKVRKYEVNGEIAPYLSRE